MSLKFFFYYLLKNSPKKLRALLGKKIVSYLKEIQNMFSVFLSSYRNTRESLGDLEKAVETLVCGLCSHSIPRSSKLPLVFL